MAADDLNKVPSYLDEVPVPLMPEGVSPEAYREALGEDLCETLKIESWRSGRDLGEEYHRIEEEVRTAVERESALQEEVRERIHPKLVWALGAPHGAGRHEVPLDELEAVHRGLLFNGEVEACDGNSNVHDTLALTIHQLAVGLVSYKGDQGTWCTRLFRRDLHQNNGDPIADTLAALERRDRRGGLDHADSRDQLSNLVRRAVMSYAERAILLRRSKALWRMGHGLPAPLELLHGGGSPDLMIESIRVIRELVLGHQKFVFVGSDSSDRVLRTVGEGLRPLEYAIVCTLDDRLRRPMEGIVFHSAPTVDTTWDGKALTPDRWLIRFRDEVASKIVVGTYRATLLAPAHLFYAHVDHADIAARIAIADSMFQEQRGFPTLIDMADNLCSSIYGGRNLKDMAAAAYAAAGAPFRFTTERTTRPRS